jgi:inorganic pyrophosphatase
MKYFAIIEMPKGETRRIHLSYNKSEGFIDLGPIKEQIPVNDGVMPVHYGYIENTLNSEDDDNVDVLIFSSLNYKTGDKVEIEIIGMLNRKDGDHKVIATDTSISINDFSEVPKDEQKLILDYFGYKSEIISIDEKAKAFEYIEKSLIN